LGTLLARARRLLRATARNAGLKHRYTQGLWLERMGGACNLFGTICQDRLSILTTGASESR